MKKFLTRLFLICPLFAFAQAQSAVIVHFPNAQFYWTQLGPAFSEEFANEASKVELSLPLDCHEDSGVFHDAVEIENFNGVGMFCSQLETRPAEQLILTVVADDHTHSIIGDNSCSPEHLLDIFNINHNVTLTLHEETLRHKHAGESFTISCA